LKNNLIHIYVVISSGALLLTGVAKIFSTLGTADLLKLMDPIFGMPYKYLFALAGAVELLVALACHLNISQIVRVSLVGWLALCIAVYRLAFHYLGPSHWCPCLGTFTENLHIDPQMADFILDGALAYMIIGCLVILANHYYIIFTKKTLLNQG